MTYDTSKPYVENVIDIIKTTWENPLCSVEECGPYALITLRTNARQVDHTDGIGTKGYYHWKHKSFLEASQDAFAMNFNDLLLMGARPFKCQNQITLPEDDHGAIIAIVKGLAEQCKKYSVALTGGETSIHNNIDGMDLSVSMTGVVSSKFVGRFKAGDTIIGYPSNGLHSNGFTKLRKQWDEKPGMFWFDHAVLTRPTIVYARQVWDIGFDMGRINALVHITGGAYTKLTRFMSNDVDIELTMPKIGYPDIFKQLSGSGIPCEEMYKTFNCGWGLLLGTSKPEEVMKIAPGTILGRVVEGGGRIKIKSAFSTEEVVY